MKNITNNRGSVQFDFEQVVPNSLLAQQVVDQAEELQAVSTF